MNILSKIFHFVKQYQYHLFLVACIVLISFTSFNLGKIVSHEKGQLKITEGANIYKSATTKEGMGDNLNSTPKLSPKPLDLRVVVSKASDSKKYHYNWCNTWRRIKIENQIWFNTEAEAIAAGYTLAGNCTK